MCVNAESVWAHLLARNASNLSKRRHRQILHEDRRDDRITKANMIRISNPNILERETCIRE